MTTILFVCTGNICRSPMAAGLLRRRLEDDPERHGWRVLSAGTWAAEGRPASECSVAEMADRGIDIRAHRSRSVNEQVMAEADLVLVMTRNHAEALSAAFPDYADKVNMLSELVGESHDIWDPYGGTRLEYTTVARELEQLIDEGYPRIVSLAEDSSSD
ncbi:MAG: low molecular weight protein arginine phosphatase [Anaerolineae bacterium]